MGHETGAETRNAECGTRNAERGTRAPRSVLRGPRSYICLVLLGSLVLGATGCGKSPVRKKPGSDDAPAVAASDEALESASEALYKRTDLTSCQAAIQQLNAYLGRRPKEHVPQPLTESEQARLETDFAIDRDEMRELGSTTFTTLDASYLESCFLFRDAARTLQLDGLPVVDQARAAFEWTMRQVRPDDGLRDLAPEAFALRRGRGTDLERSLVFLAVLQQLGIDGCLVQIQPAEKAGLPRMWAGARIDKDIYLFDCKLGLPLPGPEGQAVATVAQLRKEPKLLSQLNVDSQNPYDVQPDQLQKVAVLWYCPLSALAPRMQVLENILGDKNRVRLAVDYAAALDKLRAAVADPGVPVRTRNENGQPFTLARLLRFFLPASEGGTDAPRIFPIQALPGYALIRPGQTEGIPSTNKQFAVLELAPWTTLPESVRRLYWNMDLGRLSRAVFANEFEQFFFDPQKGRNLMLRGQFDEATRALVAERERFQLAKQQLRAEPTLERDFSEWCEQANLVYADLARAEREAARKKEGADEALKAVKERLQAHWKAGQQGLMTVLLRALADPMDAEIGYAIALCKQEQAERLEAALHRPGAQPAPAEVEAVQKAWDATIEWWRTLENDHYAAPAAVAARRLHARACVALNQKDAAIALLENLSGPITDAEKVARLYRAKRLKQ